MSSLKYLNICVIINGLKNGIIMLIINGHIKMVINNGESNHIFYTLTALAPSRQ